MRTDLEQAAHTLLAHIGGPPGVVSVSTFCANDRVALRVSIDPSCAHLRLRVPKEWAGFEVLHQVVPRPRASNHVAVKIARV